MLNALGLPAVPTACARCQMVSEAPTSFGLGHLLVPFISVGVSLSAGLLGGFVTSLALQYQLHSRAAALLMPLRLGPHGTVVARCGLACTQAGAVCCCRAPSSQQGSEMRRNA